MTDDAGVAAAGSGNTQAVLLDSAMVLTTPDGIVKTWDTDAEQLFGLTSREAMGQAIQHLVGQARHAEELTEYLNNACHGGHTQCLNTLWKRKDGTPMDVSVMISPVYGSKNEVTGASIAIWHIGHRETDEVRLHLFRALLDKSSDAIEVIDQETLRYLDVNETACNTLGYTRDELLSMRVPDIDRNLTPSQWKKLGEKLQTSPSVTIESTHWRKDGSEFPVEVNISLVSIASQDFRIAVVRDISERKSDEINLKVFRTLLDKAGDAIEVIDPQTLRYLDVNEAACRNLGYSRDELLTMSVPDIHMNMAELPVQKINEDLQAHRPVIIEAVHRRKDGSTFPAEVSISQVRIDREYNIAVARDITERKEFESNLALFRNLLDKAGDGIEVVDPITLRLLDVNEAVCQMHGYSREEMLSMRVSDLDPYIAKDVLIEVNKALHTKRSAILESLHRRKDGSAFPVEINISLVRVGDQDYRVALIRDITERKRIEESLTLFRSLLDNSNDAIEVIEPGTLRFVDINETGCRDLGYSREELLRMRVYDIDAMTEEEGKAIEEEIRKSGGASFESVHRRKDGSTFPVEINVKLIELDRPYLLSIARNISERRESEAIIHKREMQLEEAQAIGHLGHWEWEIAGNRGTCSDEIYRILGRTPRTTPFTLEGFLRSIHVKDRIMVREMIRRATETGKSTEADFRVVRPNGDTRWVHAKSTTSVDVDKKPLRVFGTCQDVTEHKKAEDMMRQRLDELEHFQRTAVNREFRIKELRDEIERLKQQKP